MTTKEESRKALLEKLRSEAQDKAKTGQRKAATAVKTPAAKTPRVKTPKPELSEADKERLNKSTMSCILCNNGRERSQRWFGEHLVNVHQISLADYLEAYYEPLPEFSALQKENKQNIPPLVAERLAEQAKREAAETGASADVVESEEQTLEQTIEQPTEAPAQEVVSVDTSVEPEEQEEQTTKAKKKSKKRQQEPSVQETEDLFE